MRRVIDVRAVGVVVAAFAALAVLAEIQSGCGGSSSGDGLPALVSEVSGADLIVELPASEIDPSGWGRLGDGSRYWVYQVDIVGKETGLVTDQVPADLETVTFQRGECFDDLIAILRPHSTVILLIDFLPDADRAFGHAVAVGDGGDLIPVDWKDYGGIATFNAERGDRSRVRLLEQLGRARVEQLRPEWLPGPVTDEGRDLLELLLVPWAD